MIRYSKGIITQNFTSKYRYTNEEFIKTGYKENFVFHFAHNGKKNTNKCLDIFTFDVENTNAWLTDTGNIISYHPYESEDYWNSKQPLALVYLWQFGINDVRYYGRDLWEFLDLLDELPNEELQIFIHNLSHEQEFLMSIMTVKDTFARSPHHPMKTIFEEYENITFRCSYIMTNMSLAQWGKQIGVEKKTGQLDYDKCVRTPLTPLDDKEIEYGEYDILIMYKGIYNYVCMYDSVYDIPITSTGQIRQETKKRLYENKRYGNYIHRMIPSIDEYHLLIKCFQGGYCHCNRLHVGKIIDKEYIEQLPNINETVISHFDFTSSYPTVLLSEKYPVEKFRKRQKTFIVKDKEQREKYSFLYYVRIDDLRSINPNTYISASKCEYTGNITRDNGRVINCYGSLFYYCTDVDLDIIQWLYSGKITVLKSWYARKDYLPRNFLEYVLKLYSDKTELKGVIGQENFYARQKAFLNSLY